jgi:hypothetical protein
MKRIKTTTIRVLKQRKEPIDPNKTPGALALIASLAQSNRMGHTPSIAHAAGVWPA